MNSKLLEQKTEKHENVNLWRELKFVENWMSAETFEVHDVTGGQRDMAGDQCAKL